MSYLGWPRLHFAGRFQADTSTINNDVRHYKNDAFEPQFQAPMVGYGQGGGEQRTNGYWNPEGTGAWRMLGCRITGAALPGGLITDARENAAIGLHIAGSNDRVAGKLVDLDPQQQLVSEIWGLRIALEDDQGDRLIDSDFEVAPFIDLWQRQQIQQNFDQTLAAAYQSKLSNVTWGDLSHYPLLQQLEAACTDGLLSIRFNVFGFDRDPAADDYTTGVVVGSIGPATSKEPKHFVLGRRLEAAGSPFAPADGVLGFQAKDHGNGILTADLGNSLPILLAQGDLKDIGELFLGVAKNETVRQSDTIDSDQVAILGEIDYQNPETPDWYRQCAGVVDFDYSKDAWIGANLADHPLVLLRKLNDKQYSVLVRETIDGLYARADQFVHRLNPGDPPKNIDLYVTRYGNPAAACLTFAFDDKGISITNPGTGAVLNPDKWPVPRVGTPENALNFDATLSIDDSGHKQFRLTAAKKGPGRPRHYLDGQLYALRYTFDGGPGDYVYNFWNFISVLCFDQWDIPDQPTWYADIEPIFQQYANLYPIMSRYMVDLGDYNSVVGFVRPLILAFSLPESDPNSMPVSRDLSANKRKGILKWLKTPGPDGLPLKGTVDQRKPQGPWKVKPVAAVPNRPEQRAEPGGKFDFMMQMLEAQRKKEADDAND